MKSTLNVIFPTTSQVFKQQIPKLWHQMGFTPKHSIFCYKFLTNPDNFIPSRMVWMVTFCKSAGPPILADLLLIIDWQGGDHDGTK